MTRTIDLTCSGVSWQVREGGPDGLSTEEIEELFDPTGLRLEEWAHSGQARVVKTGPHRTVYHVALAGPDVYVKHYRSGKKDWARALGRTSPARRELETTLAVAGRGVPTLVALAVGEAEDGDSFLITRALPHAYPLDGYLESLEHFPRRRLAVVRSRLAQTVGRFLALLHRGGVTQRDLHPGNVLVQGGDELRLFLIDLNGTRLGEPLAWPASRANLVVLNRWFMLRSGRADRLRAWRAYEEERWGASERDADRPRDLERRTLASNLRFWRHHDARCLGVNRYFRQVSSACALGHAVADLAPDALAPFLADPDAPFTWPGVKVLKHSASSSVIELELKRGEEVRPVIYKRFSVTTWTDPFVALVRPTPALRSHVMGHGLRLRGLPTPRPLAVWHRIRHGLRREGYLLTEKVPDAVELVAFVSRLAPAGRQVVLRPLIDQVARLIRGLHARHLSHRDLKGANLLVSPAGWRIAAKGVKEVAAAAETTEGAAAPPLSVWFIDLVGARRHGKLRRGRRLQNLARLHTSFQDHPGLTRTDKLRFLRRYLAWGLRGRMGWKRWWREIEAATRAKVERNLRKGRPVG